MDGQADVGAPSPDRVKHPVAWMLAKARAKAAKLAEQAEAASKAAFEQSKIAYENAKVQVAEAELGNKAKAFADKTQEKSKELAAQSKVLWEEAELEKRMKADWRRLAEHAEVALEQAQGAAEYFKKSGASTPAAGAEEQAEVSQCGDMHAAGPIDPTFSVLQYYRGDGEPRLTAQYLIDPKVANCIRSTSCSRCSEMITHLSRARRKAKFACADLSMLDLLSKR